MIQLGEQVRLSAEELDELEVMGGARPEFIKTLSELRSFMARRVDVLNELHALGALTPEGRLLGLLLEDKAKALGEESGYRED